MFQLCFCSSQQRTMHTHTHVKSVQRCAMSSSLLSFVDRWIRCSLCAKPLFFSIIIIQNLFEITKLLILSLQNNKTKQKSNGICVFEITFFENKLKKNQKWSVWCCYCYEIFPCMAWHFLKVVIRKSADGVVTLCFARKNQTEIAAADERCVHQFSTIFYTLLLLPYNMMGYAIRSDRCRLSAGRERERERERAKRCLTLPHAAAAAAVLYTAHYIEPAKRTSWFTYKQRTSC